jgi:hypothetical protein
VVGCAILKTDFSCSASGDGVSEQFLYGGTRCMSYSKMNVEIEKYLKANNLPIIGKSTDTKEQTEYRLRSYDEGRCFVFEKWIKEKKYRELISCAHGGWFNAEIFLVPLAQNFVGEKDLHHLRLLCERGIRFNLEDIIKLVKYAKGDIPNGYQTEDLFVDIELFVTGKKQFDDFENGTYATHVKSIADWKSKALRKLDRYIGFLKQFESSEYLQAIELLREKTERLQIRKADLDVVKFKG